MNSGLSTVSGVNNTSAKGELPSDTTGIKLAEPQDRQVVSVCEVII
jgi:hypothetical protein